ncbi:amidohydrolase family protein [Anaeroselena agilis]|uniref:Amidohydrolase family protein n=1 Tax=Anaeroselena agilis TaxID=3063788 RepID=A0ABU3P0K0_9FIRM|nr:amidohydrolase family protein [Selenomonadales bacterium 4137-cl]
MLIKAGLLLDGSGAPPCYDRFIAVENGKIAAVGGEDDFAVEQVERAVDYSPYTVLPGLIDCHVHLFLEGIADMETRRCRWREGREIMLFRAARNLELTLRKGVTTVRDLGGPYGIATTLKQAVGKKVLPGPRVLTCHRSISVPGGHFHYAGGREASGPEEIAKAVREQTEAGADCVKLMATGLVDFRTGKAGAPELTKEDIESAVAEARRVGSSVSVHANGADGVQRALIAQADTIEHGILMGEKTLDLFDGSSAYWVPTLSPLRQMLACGPANPAQPEVGLERIYSGHCALVRRGIDAGADIIAGTDAGSLGVAHGEVWQELALFTALGMSPPDAVQAATGRAAKAIGVSDVTGTVEPGKNADLLVVRGNPLRNMSFLRNVIQVYKDGESILSAARQNQEKRR